MRDGDITVPRLQLKGSAIMSSASRFSLRRSLAATILLGAFHAGAAHADAVIDFSTLPQESVDGVTADGVTFGYTEYGFSSPEALFDVAVGTGNTQLVSPYALVGPADGVLTMTFAAPASAIEFAVALTTNLTLTPGYTVTVYGASGNVLDTDAVTTTALDVLSEGAFTYDGAAASSLAISFDSADANEFALGNVTIPEPSGLGVFAAGLAILAVVAFHRQGKSLV